MNADKASNKINVTLKKWVRDTPKLVVAIDGYTGVGKTTLLKNLVTLNSDILAVNQDDFLLPRKTVEKLLKQAKDRSKVFELKATDSEKIADLIKSFRKGIKTYNTKVYNPLSGKIDIPKRFDLSKNILVIEGVFMFHPKLLNNLWDKRIYLDGNVKKIDEWRIRREKKRWGKDYFPETHPDSYFRQVIIALKRYNKIYKPEKKADLIIMIK